jgi:putative membrane protein
MNTLAHDGPGPWIVFFPLFWAAAVAGVVVLLRRTVWRSRGAGHGPGQHRHMQDQNSPLYVLGRRFASGEIDEDEYWRRLSVLGEEFGRAKGGAA